MNYPIDLKYLNSLRHTYFHPIEEVSQGGIYIVVNLNHEHDKTFGVGPTNFAFARYDAQTKKWMSLAYPEDEISVYDFPDINAHNVCMGHNGKITHYIDDYDLSCFITDILVDNFKLKSGKTQ